MIRMTFVVAAAVLVTACGPQWEGTYAGTFSWNELCSDGINTNSAVAVEWQLMENSGVLTVSPLTGTCGSFTADVKGEIATFRTKACPPATGTDGHTYTPQLTGGSLSLEDERLTGSMTFVTSFSGPTSGTCNANAGVDMVRKAE